MCSLQNKDKDFFMKLKVRTVDDHCFSEYSDEIDAVASSFTAISMRSCTRPQCGFWKEGSRGVAKASLPFDSFLVDLATIKDKMRKIGFREQRWWTVYQFSLLKWLQRQPNINSLDSFGAPNWHIGSKSLLLIPSIKKSGQRLLPSLPLMCQSIPSNWEFEPDKKRYNYPMVTLFFKRRMWYWGISHLY
jgi:hypothetical protein